MVYIYIYIHIYDMGVVWATLVQTFWRLDMCKGSPPPRTVSRQGQVCVGHRPFLECYRRAFFMICLGSICLKLISSLGFKLIQRRMIQNARRRITGKGGKTAVAGPNVAGPPKNKVDKVRRPLPSNWQDLSLTKASMVSAATGNIRTYIVGRWEMYGAPMMY